MCFRALFKNLGIQLTAKQECESVNPNSRTYGLPEVAYDEFRKLCASDGFTLSEKQVVGEANNLITLFKTLTQDLSFVEAKY